MNRRPIVTAAALMALAAAPALGQQHEHGQQQGDTPQQGQMMQMMRGDMMGMMQTMHPQPRMLLAASDQLGLTAEQTRRLTTLNEGVSADHMSHMKAAMAAHKEAASALEGDSPDLDAYAADLSDAADHMVRAHVAMTRAAVEAKRVLTPEQREKLQSAKSMMRHMQGGMMGGGMMGSDGMMDHR